MTLGKFFSKIYHKRLYKKLRTDHKVLPPAHIGKFVFILTNRCNFSCKHCLRGSYACDDMPLEIAKKALEAGKKYRFGHVALTGGEPLLYPHFKELLGLIAENGYTCSINTNGFLLDKYLDLLKKHKQNITALVFSLESADQKKHDALRHPGSYDRLLKDFKICRELSIPFSVVSATSSEDAAEVFDLALFAKKKGAHALVLTTTLPCPKARVNTLTLDTKKREALYETILEVSRILKFPILTTGALRANNNIRMCQPMNLSEISIDASGHIVQCCDLANFDSELVTQRAQIVSLKNLSFDDALKALSEYLHRFACDRIDNYQTQEDTTNIDFNSCFYCVNRLSQPDPIP